MDSSLGRNLQWRSPYWDTNLQSGGAQLRRLISEFRQHTEALEIPFERHELRAILHSVTDLDLRGQALEVAQRKFRECIEPFISKLFKRTLKILKRLANIVDSSVQTHMHLSSPYVMDIKKEGENNHHNNNNNTNNNNNNNNHQQRHPDFGNNKYNTNNVMAYKSYQYFTSNSEGTYLLQQRTGFPMGTKLKQSSPQLAFLVKDCFYSYMKDTVNRAKRKCLDEVGAKHLLYCPSSLIKSEFVATASFLPVGEMFGSSPSMPQPRPRLQSKIGQRKLELSIQAITRDNSFTESTSTSQVVGAKNSPKLRPPSESVEMPPTNTGTSNSTVDSDYETSENKYVCLSLSLSLSLSLVLMFFIFYF